MDGRALFCVALAAPALAFGWGAGHDAVGKALAARLPTPWRERLQGAALERFCVDNHYPDARTDFKSDPRMTPEEVSYLAGRKMVNSGQFHSDEGRGVAFTLLVRALRENRSEGALLWLAALSHSTADMAACNHDPIVHLATYGWSDPGWDFRLPGGKLLSALDLGWVETVPEAKAVWEARLARVRAVDSEQDADSAVLDVMLAGLHGVEACAPYGVPIVRRAAAWSNSRDTANGAALAQSLSELGCWAVERLLRDFLAAARLAKGGGDPEVTDVVMARYRQAFEAFTENRRFEDDSLVRGLTAPLRPDAPFVAVLAEPTWRMNDGMFGFNDRVLAAQAASSLRRRGVNVALTDVRAFMANGLSATRTPAVLVFAQKASAYFSLQPRTLVSRLAAYRKAGGKIVWVGGGVPDAVLCDLPKDAAYRADVGAGYAYSWTRLPVATNAYATLALTIGSRAARTLAHSPSFRAGWHIPSNTTVFRPEAEASLRPLARLDAGGMPLLVGGAWPKDAPAVAYLPTYAVYPYLWTAEAPSLVPFELGLDSLGEEALESALAAVAVGRLTEK